MSAKDDKDEPYNFLREYIGRLQEMDGIAGVIGQPRGRGRALLARELFVESIVLGKS